MTSRWGPRTPGVLRVACDIAADAAAACDTWSLSIGPHAGPAGWTSPAHRAASRILSAHAASQAAVAYCDLRAAIARDAELLAAASTDPVSLYLYRTGGGSSAELAPTLDTVPFRVGMARGSAAAALGLVELRPGGTRAAALAAVGAALLAELRTVVQDGFVGGGGGGGGGAAAGAQSGLDALERVLWASPRVLPKPAPPVQPVIVAPPEEVTSKGARGRGSAVGGGAGGGRASSGGPPAAGAAGARGAAAKRGAGEASQLALTASAAVGGPLAPTAPGGPPSGSVLSTAPAAAAPTAPPAAPFVPFTPAVGPPLLPADMMPLAQEHAKAAPAALPALGEPWLQSLAAASSSSLPSHAPPLAEGDAAAAAAAASRLPPVPELSPTSFAAALTLRSRAVAVLTRALADAVAQQAWGVAEGAAGSLVECLGSAALSGAPVQAAAAVVMLQSACAAAALSDLLAAALHPSSPLRLHTRQRDALDAAFTFASSMPARAAAAQFLASQSLATRMLDCSRPLEATLAALPPGTRVLVLQVRRAGGGAGVSLCTPPWRASPFHPIHPLDCSARPRRTRSTRPSCCGDTPPSRPPRRRAFLPPQEGRPPLLLRLHRHPPMPLWMARRLDRRRRPPTFRRPMCAATCQASRPAWRA